MSINTLHKGDDDDEDDDHDGGDDNNNNNNVATLRTCESNTSANAEKREQMWFAATIVDTESTLTAPIEMVVNTVIKAY